MLVSALLLLSALAMAAMPWLMYLLAPGCAAEPEKFDLAVELSRITFPYLLFMSLVALLSGLLNSLNRFAAAAAAPILLNVCFIVALVVVLPLTGAPGQVLDWAVVVAGVKANKIPAGKCGGPEPRGEMGAFLASDRAAWVAGACINVDGGQSRSLI